MADCTCDGDRVSYPVVPGEPGWDNDCAVHGVRALLMTPLKPGTIEKLSDRLAELERTANQRQSVRLTIWFEPGVDECDVEDLTEAAIETLARFRQVEEVTVIEDIGSRRQVDVLTDEHRDTVWADTDT